MSPAIHDFKMQFHKQGGSVVTFEPANEDTTDATYHYYGYISSFGSWIVQRFHIIGDTVKYEYAAGQSRADYDAVWNETTGEYIGSLTFGTFDTLGDNL